MPMTNSSIMKAARRWESSAAAAAETPADLAVLGHIAGQIRGYRNGCRRGERESLQWMISKMKTMFEEGYAYTCFTKLVAEAKKRVEELEKEAHNAD